MAEYNISDLSSDYDLSNQFKSNIAFIMNGVEGIFWCKSYNLPGKSMTPIEEERSPYNFKIPTDDFQYEEFTLDFFVQEDFSNFFIVDDWLERFRKRENTEDDVVYANLYLFNNQNTKVICRAEFKDLFATSFNGFEFNNLKTNESLIMNVGFAYDKWEIKK